MYVCLCNGFTDRQVRAARETAEGCVSGVYEALGCVARCGKCVPTVRDILREAGGVEPQVASA